LGCLAKIRQQRMVLMGLSLFSMTLYYRLALHFVHTYKAEFVHDVVFEGIDKIWTHMKKASP
jgi:hypothetical protein